MGFWNLSNHATDNKNAANLNIFTKSYKGLFTVFCHSIIAHFQEGVYYMSRNILAKYKNIKKKGFKVFLVFRMKPNKEYSYEYYI